MENWSVQRLRLDHEVPTKVCVAGARRLRGAKYLSVSQSLDTDRTATSCAFSGKKKGEAFSAGPEHVKFLVRCRSSHRNSKQQQTALLHRTSVHRGEAFERRENALPVCPTGALHGSLSDEISTVRGHHSEARGTSIRYPSAGAGRLVATWTSSRPVCCHAAGHGQTHDSGTHPLVGFRKE